MATSPQSSFYEQLRVDYHLALTHYDHVIGVQDVQQSVIFCLPLPPPMLSFPHGTKGDNYQALPGWAPAPGQTFGQGYGDDCGGLVRADRPRMDGITS